ncbi:penicillin acylase family protein [Flavihumibacter sp. R14]|nr:penicillin acylase family protein [Flavihumibacter soli]
MKLLKAVIALSVTLILVIVLNSKLGDIPPLGKFLDPFHGFWQNAEPRDLGKNQELRINGLKGKVEIRFDDQMIPHIFAENDHDLFLAQGYITAKDRLWQMDFQTRFAAGRLSEVIGDKAIELDKYQRRMGMPFGAENMVKAMQKDPQMLAVMQAYADGVNAYINSLNPSDYPIEFKILNYKPEEWKIINSAFLLKLMSATLSGGSNEFYMNNILSEYGPEVVKNLFPDYPYREDPIIPAGTKWNFKPVEIPQPPALLANTGGMNILTKEKVEGIGSNNWAVSGAKSATGFPMLANDPHLELSLPSIWYQIQLAGDVSNVYGVSLPGAPGVIIGFNKDVAWGVTNVDADVLDWYKVRFKDETKKEYWYNNTWHKVKQRIETIKIRGGGLVTDTVYYTHHGPVVYLEGQKPANFAKVNNIPTGHALRWVAHDPSNEFRAIYQLNHSKNYDDYRSAIKYFNAPAQNFIFASAGNDIAITPNGYFPLKYKDQGKFILDGSLPANDWHGRIPAAHNPTVKNPARGFVSSANQSSTDQTYPYYINWEFADYERGHRINKRLTAMSKASVDSMRSLQNDNYSMLAENIKLDLIRTVKQESLNASQKEALKIVSEWNNAYDSGEMGASIFEIWRKLVEKNIWDDEFTKDDRPMRYPSRDRMVEMLLNEPDARWYDNINTASKETKTDIIQLSFVAAVDSLQDKYGSISDRWEWGNVKHSHVPHLAKIGGFGSKFINNGGSKASVNAMSETNGPSWRMVIQLGKNVKGYGVFPGGESGNPGSFYYDDMIDTWSSGKLNELLFLRSKAEQSKRIRTTWSLSSK